MIDNLDKNADVRGLRFAITNKVGRVALSGGIPLLGDKTAPASCLAYYTELADTIDGSVFLALSNISKSAVGQKGKLICGMTWDQIQTLQQRGSIPEYVKSVMPTDAVMVYCAVND